MNYILYLSILSLAPQLKGDIIINGVNVGRPINENKLKKALKQCFPLLSIVRYIDVNASTNKSRQEFSFKVKSIRAINQTDLKVSGINTEFYTFKVEVINV